MKTIIATLSLLAMSSSAFAASKGELFAEVIADSKVQAQIASDVSEISLTELSAGNIKVKLSFKISDKQTLSECHFATVDTATQTVTSLQGPQECD